MWPKKSRVDQGHPSRFGLFESVLHFAMVCRPPFSIGPDEIAMLKI
jgi:hypothetical protein